MVINKFPNREVYEKIKAKGSLGANDVNVLENYPGPELPDSTAADAGKLLRVGADGNAAWGDKLPTALKNPNALTFTGAAMGTYDGSAALTVNIPAGGSSGSGGALKAMSAVGRYIGIPAADLPENGVVWMCFGSGDSTELYTGTVTIQDAWIAVNDMLVITNGIVNPLNQVSLVSDGLAVYGLSASDYRGVYQVAGAGGASGENLSLGTASAAVGQIAKISAVDVDGVPTVMEPVDMPSGGGDWITIVDLTLTVAASISQSVSLIGYAEVIVQFEMPKVDAVIQSQGSASPISTAGLYYEKIGSTNYQWRYTAHAWLDRDGNIVNSIIAFGPSSGIGQQTNVCTQAKPQGTIGSVFRIVPEMPSGTKLKILAK